MQNNQIRGNDKTFNNNDEKLHENDQIIDV